MSGHRSGAKRPKAAPPQQLAADTEADKRPGRGRKSEYTPEIGAAICERLAKGETLLRICEDAGMPSRDCVYGWMFRHKEFGDSYARARCAQMDVWAEELVEMAEGEESKGVDPKLLKVRLDNRRWIMGRLSAKKYGDRSALDVEVKHSLADMLVQLNQRRQSGDDATLIGEGTGDDG